MQAEQPSESLYATCISASSRAIAVPMNCLKLSVDLPPAGPDQLFVRVHDAFRYCEDMAAGMGGTANGYALDGFGHGEHQNGVQEPLLTRSSIDCV